MWCTAVAASPPRRQRGRTRPRGQGELLLPRPRQRLPHAAELGKAPKDEPDRLLHALVRVLRGAATCTPMAAS